MAGRGAAGGTLAPIVHASADVFIGPCI